MANHIITYCETCKSPVQHAHNPKKYCSMPCYRAAQRAGKYKPGPRADTHRQPCRNCGALVIGVMGVTRDGSRTEHKYCDRKCYDEYRANAIKAREGKRCQHCDVVIPGKKTQSKGRLYCSMSCRKLGMRPGAQFCVRCGCHYSPVEFSRGCITNPGNRRTCSAECHIAWIREDPERKRKISEAFKGAKHPNWQGGTHHSKGRGAGWPKIAEKVRKRAGYKCEHCGIDQESHGRALEVNHKTPFHQFGGTTELANRLGNLEALCKKCHTTADWKWRKSNPVQLSLMPSRW